MPRKLKKKDSELRWMYCGLGINGKKEAGTGLTLEEITKVILKEWLAFDVKSYQVTTNKKPQTRQMTLPAYRRIPK